MASQIVCHATCNNKLQLGIPLLQLLVVSLRDRGHTDFLSSLFGTITPFGKGTQSQETESKQRDLLPMPLPAFGALLNPVKELKRSGSGVILWDPDEARRICKQQRESSAWGKLVPASDHIETRSQRAALAGLSRRCAWWTAQALQARPANFIRGSYSCPAS